MILGVNTRIRNRLNGENLNDVILDELEQTITDRLCLRLSVTEDKFPKLMQSIIVDATVKAWRRRYYEGFTSEKAGELSNAFIEDILSEYQQVINKWLNDKEKEAATGTGLVRFL